MKSKPLTPLIILFLLTAFIVPAHAEVLPEVSGDYTITTSPAVDPAAGAIVVVPGQTVVITAKASGTYSGPTLNDFPVKATIETHLYRAAVDVASNTETISQAIDLATGAIPPTSVTTSITLPADLAPGLYTLKTIATLNVEYLGIGYTWKSPPELFIVKVVAPASTAGSMATPAPTSTPVTTSYNVDSTSVSVEGNGNTKFRSGEVTGTTDAGAAAGSVLVDLAQVPSGSLNMYVLDEPDPAAETQFMLAAAGAGSDIRDIAYVLVVDKAGLSNGADIASATITMKASPEWVNANGGVGAIKILRYSEGMGEALATSYAGTEGNLMVFEAFSPNGLSQFALAAVASLPLTAAETAPQGARVGATLIIGVVAFLVVVLASILGVAYVLTHRKKKEQ